MKKIIILLMGCAALASISCGGTSSYYYPYPAYEYGDDYWNDWGEDEGFDEGDEDEGDEDGGDEDEGDEDEDEGDRD